MRFFATLSIIDQHTRAQVCAFDVLSSLDELRACFSRPPDHAEADLVSWGRVTALEQKLLIPDLEIPFDAPRCTATVHFATVRRGE